MEALFVSASNSLGIEGRLWGGVQICTNEYLAVLRRAGFEITVMTFEVDKRLSNRVIKKLRRAPYENVLPPGLNAKIFAAVRDLKAGVVFLNQVDLAPVAKSIRKEFGSEVKSILLSHGLNSADMIHDIRISSRKDDGIAASAVDLRRLAANLIAECDQRQYLDHVFCLSEFETGLEKWLGSRSVSWLPRIVTADALPWRPVPGRVGFVGTLDHPPNAEGIELFLTAAKKKGGETLSVRVVGGPESKGVGLKHRFGGQVEYLGRLDDHELKMEAATWSCALHPLFCYCRGCSTKLAVLLGWQIPLVTTAQGCRGYVWKQGDIPQATTPEEMVDLAVRTMDVVAASKIRDDIVRVVASSPTSTDLANLVRQHLIKLL